MLINSYYTKTTDNFQPNILSDLVSVRLDKLAPDSDKHRVGVWGGDDFGMYLDFDTYHAAQKLFFDLSMFDTINSELLLSLGFTYF